MTLIQLFPFLGLFLGFIVGPWLGIHLGDFYFVPHSHFARATALLIWIIASYSGYRLGCLPFEISMRHTVRELQRKSTEQLWKEFYDEKMGKRDRLMMLKIRGEPLGAGLDHVLSQMDAENRQTRIFGFVAFRSVFPELETLMNGYQIDMPEAQRHEVIKRVRASLPDNMRVKDTGP